MNLEKGDLVADAYGVRFVMLEVSDGSVNLAYNRHPFDQLARVCSAKWIEENMRKLEIVTAKPKGKQKC
jgi:hypothetical protein